MEELLTRGIERIYPSKEELEKVLAGGQKLRIYWGIDPTGPNLHIGHAVNLLKLKEFQDQGHEIIVLIGDFTAQIGDPTDKTAARVKLSPDQVKENLKNYQTQIDKVLDPKKTSFKFNSEWLAKLSFGEVLELGSEFTVSQMIERDMFQERIKQGQPIYLHEFFYPLMQGYDSVVLSIDAEVGASDQTFNMLAGRTMLKRRGKEKFVIANKLLVDPSGKKMGKTEGNMVALDDVPEEMYGKVMSWPDTLLPLAIEICTRLPEKEVISLAEQDPKAAKMKLAHEIVQLYHGREAADAAEESFINTFQKKEIPTDLEEIPVEAGASLGEVLVSAGVVESKSEFRRLVEQGAIHDLDGDKITDSQLMINKPLRLKVGKKRFIRITL